MFFRLRTAAAYRYFDFKTRELDSTPPLPSDAAADCEVHTMLGTRDVTMYLVAIKTLLSHVRSLAVVVHSDGTLTRGQMHRVRRHLPGMRLVLADEADAHARQRLAERPFLAKWRGVDAAYRRLIDVALLRRTRRAIILDSDVLTASDPREVREWLTGGSRPFLLGQTARSSDVSTTTPANAHVQAQFLARVPDLSAALHLPAEFLQGTTAGFCGFFDELSLDRVERALRAAVDLQLPMEQWGGDQCLIIYLLSTAGGERLPCSRYLNFEPSLADAARAATMLHFYGTHRFYRRVYPTMAADAVRRLHVA